MANITIKTSDPQMAGAIAEGAATIELRTMQEQFGKLQAREGVRAEAENRRWERTKRKLARKYAVRPVGRVEGAILGAWGLLWYGINKAYDRLSAINREA